MTQETIKELRVCKGCETEYEAYGRVVLGVRVIFGRDYCPTCSKKLIAGMEAKEEAARLAGIAAQRRKWRETCGIPPKFMNEDFSTFQKERQAKAYQRCVIYADNFPLLQRRGIASLLLFSEASWGVGKTHLAGSIAHRILDRWNGEDIACPVLFISEPEIYRRIQATYNFSPEEKSYRESEQDIINRLISVRLLILDDLGKEKRSDPRFIQRTLFAIIDGRYRYQLPMVITTNLSQEKLKLYLGGRAGDEASYDRICELTGRKFIRMDGESYRRFPKE